jgi:phage tail protein X
MRYRTVALLGMLTLAATTATAAVSTYVVGYGDTLSDISFRFYGTSEYWDEILAANPYISAPEALQPGMELILPDVPGGAVRSSSAEAYTASYIQAPTLAANAPMLSRLRLEQAGFIAVDAVQAVARIVGVNVEENEAAANDDAYVGDIIEIDLGSGSGVSVGAVYTILDSGETAIDPETGEELGPVVRVAGVCRVLAVTSSTSVALVEQSCMTSKVGDLLIPYQPAGNVPVNSQPATDDLSVWVVALQDSDATTAYAYDVLFLNKGSEAGLHPGDVFQAFEYGSTATGLDGDLIQTADIPIAEVVILSVQRTTCSAMVSQNRTNDLLLVGDRLHLARRQASSSYR